MDDAKREALDHYQEIPDEEFGDLFVVLWVPGALFVRSTQLHLMADFAEFREEAKAWAAVELAWWCEDHEKGPAETDALAASLTPVLFHLDGTTGGLGRTTAESYERSRRSPARSDRQFALLGAETPTEAIRQALRRRVAEVHGTAGPA